MIEPAKGLWQTVPRHRPQDRVMSFSGIDNGYFPILDPDRCLAFDKVPVKLGGVALFKTSQMVSKHTVKRIGNHGHEDIEVDLDQNRRREAVEMEELDGFGDGVLQPPSPRIVSHQEIEGGLEVVGDQAGRFFMAIAPHNDLAQHSLVIPERDERMVDLGMGIFSFLVGDMNPLPGGELIQVLQELLAPAPEGNELDALTVEFRKVGVGGKFGIKDKGGFDPPVHTLPEGQKAQDLISGFFTLYIGRRVKDQLGVGILGKEDQDPFHSLSPGACPVFLQYGFIPPNEERCESPD